MRYRIECLTPLLVGDGSSLSPIDYMVWKDQVNVLDQRKIFKLLSKGPRLDGYLNQVKKAEKLDFASWGGFAQNFAGRRIPFEHPSSAIQWEKQRAEFCHIPTFARNHQGAFLPGSALRGALRTALVSSRLDAKTIEQFQQALASAERAPRRPGEALEHRAISGEGGRGGGWDIMKAVAIADSAPADAAAMKIYLLRTASLAQAKTQSGYALAWKQARGGSVDGRRPDDSTPVFAEMAVPGTVFEGSWTDRDFYRRGEIRHVLHWKNVDLRQALVNAANAAAAVHLADHRRFADFAGLTALRKSVDMIEARLAQLDAQSNSCLLNLGWGGGLLGKLASPASPEPGGDTPPAEPYRRLLAAQPMWSRAIRTGMPFPKTRRIVFQGGAPATLPGWVLLKIG